MPEDVLINFIGKTDELQPAEDALQDIIDKSGDVGEAWKKTAAAMSAGAKTSIENTNKLAKSIDQLAVAAKSADKAVIGGAYKEYLKQLQTQLGLTTKEVINYLQNARKAAQESIFLAKTDQEAKEFSLSIEVINEQLKELGANEDEVGGKTQSLRSRIKEAKEELVAMAEAGLQGTPAFQALQQKAGELDDQMRDLNASIKNTGSDTKNLDGLIGVATGVAGGFALAQGAAALFGDESEDVQKALVKLNAVMSILQGLQAVQNVVQKESAASLLLTSIFYKQNTVAITENTVATEANVVAEASQVAGAVAVTAAEGAQIVATEAATVAQVELNTAMSLNPIAVVITAVVALVGALAFLTSNNNEAAKSQIELNDALSKSTLFLDGNLKTLERQTARELALAKQKGASSIDLVKLEGKSGEQRLKIIDDARVAAANAYNQSKSDDKESIALKQKLYERIFQLQEQYQEESNALRIKSIEFQTELSNRELKSFIAFQDAKVLATRSGSIAEKNAQIENIRATREAKDKLNPDMTPGEAAKNAAEDARAVSDIQLQIFAFTLKSITSLQEANLSIRKQNLIKNQADTIASIKAITEAEISAIRARTNEQLKSNPNLSGGERAKIQADANLQIAQLNKELSIKLLEIKKAGVNAELILAQRGTQEELDAKLSSIQIQQSIELAATELNAEKIQEINAKAQKSREDAQRAFNEAQIQNLISLGNAELDVFGINESQKLVITLKRLNDQRALETSQADDNAAKIAEINAKYDRQIVESKKATIRAILANNLQSFDVFTEQSKTANERILASDKATYAEKKAASDQLLSNELIRLDLERKALTKQVEDNLITNEDFNVRYQEILNKRAAATIANEEKVTALTLKEIDKRTTSISNVFSVFQKGLSATLPTSGLTVALQELQNFGAKAQDISAKLKARTISNIDAFKELAGAAIATTQQVVNQLFSDSTAARQQRLSDTISQLEEQKSKELENKNLTEQQKADIEAKYKEKEKQEKVKAFLADKQAKKEQAVINGLLAVTQAFATNPFPYSLIVAGIVAASTAIQVAKINSSPVPKFRHGKVDIQGPGTTTSDSIPAMISRGESVIKADATAKWKDALVAINNDNFEGFLKNKMADFIFPAVPEGLSANVVNQSIDYEKLSISIAEKMKGIIPGPKSTHVIIDKNGIMTIVKDAGSQTIYKNARLSVL